MGLKAKNVVGIAKIAETFDLEKLYRELDDSSYEPEQFSALIYRNIEPHGTIQIFKTGKIICMGAKDKKEIEMIISSLIQKLRFLDVAVNKTYEILIKNMVFSKDIGRKINLSQVALSFGLENVDYEPEDFPGLIFKIEEPQTTFILFESGKVICTGADSETNAEAAYDILEQKLKRLKIL